MKHSENRGQLGFSVNFHYLAGYGQLPTCLPHPWEVRFSYLEASKIPNKLVGFSYYKYRWQYLGRNKALPLKVDKRLFSEAIRKPQSSKSITLGHNGLSERASFKSWGDALCDIFLSLVEQVAAVAF